MSKKKTPRGQLSWIQPAADQLSWLDKTANQIEQGEMMIAQLEASILEATRKNDDHLDDLLREASEIMNEERFSHLLDVVHQIMRESLHELRNWKDDDE